MRSMGTWGGVARMLLAMGLLAVLPAAGAQTVEYFHTDALGTPVAVSNASGSVIERSEYAPYGELLNRPATDGPGFTGHVQDTATGMTYMQQRYYDSGIGRFLSVDPVTANPDAGANFNRYWYGNNNPYKFTDPDGRNAVTDLIRRIMPVVMPSDQSGPDDVSGSNDGDIDGDGRADGRSSGDSTPIADRPLPTTKDGEPAPDPEAEGVAHSQLGKGKNERQYPAAREFDKDGKPVRDVHWTDHGRPQNHTNPHEHPYTDNPGGGTRQRGKARPIETSPNSEANPIPGFDGF